MVIVSLFSMLWSVLNMLTTSSVVVYSIPNHSPTQMWLM
jgi:hypothetical protein